MHTMYSVCYDYLALIVDSCSIINQSHRHIDMSTPTCNNESSVAVLILYELTLHVLFLVLKARYHTDYLGPFYSKFLQCTLLNTELTPHFRLLYYDQSESEDTEGHSLQLSTSTELKCITLASSVTSTATVTIHSMDPVCTSCHPLRHLTFK